LPIEEREAKLAALLKGQPADIQYSASFTQNAHDLLSRVHELAVGGLIGEREAFSSSGHYAFPP
jgi:hypothetical protein